jgi:hypothetical protein
MIRFSRSFFAALVIAVGLVLGEAAVRPSQEAQADNWQYYLSPQWTGCMGCCSGGPVLCCTASEKCRIQPT